MKYRFIFNIKWSLKFLKLLVILVFFGINLCMFRVYDKLESRLILYYLVMYYD